MLSETTPIASESFDCFLVGIEMLIFYAIVKEIIIPRLTAILTMYVKHYFLQGYASPKGGGEFSQDCQ